jgi:monoterpene epsilon-lactone hydrolase
MPSDVQAPPVVASAWTTIHSLTEADAAAMNALRALVEPLRGSMQGPTARGPYDAIMARVVEPSGVTWQADTVGGIPGWWCRPADARPGEALLHLHGGWFNWGSAQAFRHFVGHIARHAGADAFVPDYRLAPEHPFPAALHDARDCHAGLLARGIRRIALTGDSAGGGLALALLALTSAADAASRAAPVAAVVLSPVTDLSLVGPSWDTRAAADPYFTKPQVAQLVHSYLGEHSPLDPLASPLGGDLVGLPPIRVHVGNAEMLLDDSRRYVDKAVAAGVDARLDIWDGMVHGFASASGRLGAADRALDAIGAFLGERLAAAKKL